LPNKSTRLVLVAIVAAALLAVGVNLMNLHRTASTPIVITTPAGAAVASTLVPAAPAPKAPAPDPVSTPVPAPADDEAPHPAPKAAALIYVHVAGAVKHPSLYQLAPSSRVWHAIKAAGGPSANADENAINLAAKITDGEKIFVPTKAAVVRAEAAPPAAVETAAAVAAPASVRAARAPTAAKHGGSGSAGPAGKPAKLVSASQGQVNINTAGAEQLQELPGIGPAMAARIVGYRQQAGQFQKAEDLMNVGGIGPKKFGRIAPLIKLH